MTPSTYKPVLLRSNPGRDFTKIDVHLAYGGMRAVRKALRMKPADVIETVKKSSLRGRGGAGFPAGLKWSFVPKDSPKPVYVTINADEGEPGTFKDRYFLGKDPFPVLEGTIITSYAVGCHTAYIYIRGEFFKEIKVMETAINQLYKRGYLGKNILGTGFSLDIYVQPGAGAYVCGEETGLLESIEGKPGRPRNKPPFPAVVGLFGGPTVINNVETMADVRLIFDIGAEKFLSMGLPKDGGPKLYGISGHVAKPGLYEAPMGTNLKALIYEYAGGIRGGKNLKAVIPGGLSTPVLKPDEIDISMDFDSVKAAGSMMGSGGVIVMDEDTCLPEILKRITAFYHHESCGQCTPCREGTSWMDRIMTKVVAGKGEKTDIDLMLRVAKQIMGNTICALGDAAAMPVIGFLTKYREDFEAYIENGGCNH